MTTSCVQIRIFIVLTLIATGLFGSVAVVLAEDRVFLSEEEETTTSEEIVSTPAEVMVPEVKPPWFRIEKLTGDNLAVGDFVVGPGRAEIEVKPGQTIIYEVSVANRISDNRTFELFVEDMFFIG